MGDDVDRKELETTQKKPIVRNRDIGLYYDRIQLKWRREKRKYTAEGACAVAVFGVNINMQLSNSSSPLAHNIHNIRC